MGEHLGNHLLGNSHRGTQILPVIVAEQFDTLLCDITIYALGCLKTLPQRMQASDN